MGRRSILWVGISSSLFSYVINYSMNSLQGMWIAMVPSALLNQNFSVLKALFADYSTESNESESERASAMGRLGMAIGVAFAVGSLIGSKLLSSYEQAIILAISLCSLSGLLLFLLPSPAKESVKSSDIQKDSMNLFSFFYLESAQSSGAYLLFFVRCGMTLAYHVFSTVWTGLGLCLFL